VAKVTSWRAGQVFFEDFSLAQAVAEMNKHSVLHVVIDDPDLEGLRVNGMFRAGEQQAFANALEEYFGIIAERHGDTRIKLKAGR
jgi:transmembrane sensor